MGVSEADSLMVKLPFCTHALPGPLPTLVDRILTMSMPLTTLDRESVRLSFGLELAVIERAGDSERFPLAEPLLRALSRLSRRITLTTRVRRPFIVVGGLGGAGEAGLSADFGARNKLVGPRRDG